MGIEYIERGDIFTSAAQVLVCPTNAGGVMGNGLAYAFRMKVPRLFYQYRAHCKAHNPDDMAPFVFDAYEYVVYCLHTKKKWWLNSSKEIIRDGLLKLIQWCTDKGIESVAMPALGCGKGGLDFNKEVKPLIEELLKESDMDVIVYCSW
jgi:O-acetyl-ADP-ribose deacetylase (regulator of RNase III)